MRLTSASLVPDDHVPPMLMWADLEIVHHRLVARGDKHGVGFVKYVCNAYEGELRRRREATMKGGKATAAQALVASRA